MLTEIREGRGAGPDADHLFLDLTHLTAEHIDSKLPDVTEFVRTYMGIEPKTELVPIQPTAHYAMGGIPTNVSAEVVVDAEGTVVPGLYAAGECACVSVHGANRLGTNSLLDIVVFGRRGGAAMATFVAGAPQPAVPDDASAWSRSLLEGLKTGTGTENVADIRSELPEQMTDKASVFRTRETLESMGETIDRLRARYRAVSVRHQGPTFNYELTEAVELGCLLELAEALVASALARTESRGAHFRDDHPSRDDENWMVHSLVWRDDSGALRLGYKPVARGRYEPMVRKY
jgi:succinate dehydrogenase / fumarate reductase flavoprotein subunit